MIHRKATICLMVSLIILNALAMLFYTICLGMIYNYITIGTFYKYLNTSFQFILACDFTLNFMMLSLFLYKLLQVILMMDFANDHGHRKQEQIQNENEVEIVFIRKESIKLNAQQNRMVTVMTRHTILSSIAISFNVIFYISVIYGSHIEDPDEEDIWFLAYSNMIKGIHGLFVTITIYLNFSFNHKLYFRFCNKCHLCCYHMFTKLTKRQIRKKNNNEFDYQRL